MRVRYAPFAFVALVPATFVACADAVVADSAHVQRPANPATPTAIVSAAVSPPTYPFDPSCPATMPFDGSWCDRDFVACEFGVAIDANCNFVAYCIGHTWVVSRPSLGCVDECPARIEAVPIDGACPRAGAACAYDEGTCGCFPVRAANAADAGADANADAGNTGRWHCAPRAENCPARRPLLGTPCVNPAHCDYGSCALGRSLAYTCAAGYWRAADAVCDP